MNLIGEHTDYNDGFLPCAIDYQTVISCAPRDDRKVRVMAADYENQLDEFPSMRPLSRMKLSMGELRSWRGENICNCVTTASAVWTW